LRKEEIEKKEFSRGQFIKGSDPCMLLLNYVVFCCASVILSFCPFSDLGLDDPFEP
jgi:hypothetical protein